MKLLNPWLLLGIVIAVAAAFGGGLRTGRSLEEARQARLEAAIRRASDAAQQRAAEEIAKLRVVHTTVRHQAEKVIRENVVYRECTTDPELRRLLDAARSNSAPESAGSRSVP